MIALKDLKGRAKELGIQQWLRGLNYAVVSGGTSEYGTPTYFAASPEWTANDAEFMANSLGGVAVDLRGEPMATSAEPDDLSYVDDITCGAQVPTSEATSVSMFCSRGCEEEHAGGCGSPIPGVSFR